MFIATIQRQNNYIQHTLHRNVFNDNKLLQRSIIDKFLRGLEEVDEILKVVVVEDSQQRRHATLDVLTFELVLVDVQIGNHPCRIT